MSADFLGFGDWIQQQRRDHHWSPAHVADQSGIPRTTLGAFLSPLRHLQRPRRPVATQIASALKLPVLTLAVVAGYTDRTEFGQADEAITGAVMPHWGRQAVQRRSLLWSTAGAQYLTAVASSAGLSPAVTRERWQTRTGDTVSDVDWASAFEYGYIPEHWTPHKMLDTLPGPALGLLTESVGGDAVDIIGVAAVMGRIGPELAMEWGCEDDYVAWVGKIEQQGWGQSGDFDPVAYRAAVRKIEWTIPEVPDLVIPDASNKYSVSDIKKITERTTDTEDLAYLLARYPRLTPAQRSIIRQLIASWLPD